MSTEIRVHGNARRKRWHLCNVRCEVTRIASLTLTQAIGNDSDDNTMGTTMTTTTLQRRCGPMSPGRGDNGDADGAGPCRQVVATTLCRRHGHTDPRTLT